MKKSFLCYQGNCNKEIFYNTKTKQFEIREVGKVNK